MSYSSFRTTAIAALIAAAASACEGEITNFNCPDSDLGAEIGGEAWGYAVLVGITDPAGNPATLGTTLRLLGADTDESVTGRSPDEPFLSIGNDPGVFTVVIQRPWWVTRNIQQVRVARRPSRCGGVIQTRLDVVLHPQAGAPAVRQVVPEVEHLTVGSDPPFTGSGGSGEIQLRAWAEADPGVSTAVEWHAPEPDIASITPDGVLTVRCRESTIDTHVVATSRADPGVSATIGITVNRTSLWECPKSSGS